MSASAAIRTLIGALIVVAVAAGAAYIYLDPFDSDEPEATTPEAPALFTNANGNDVWERPGYHLGARVRITGPVLAQNPAEDGVIVAIDVNGHPVGAYVFDAGFHVGQGDLILVRGNVKGPLGGELTLGIAPFGPLGAGAALIYADRAKRLPATSG